MTNSIDWNIECLECGSNARPSDLQSDALPTELSRHINNKIQNKIKNNAITIPPYK